MKSSITFRDDDQNPILRVKLPLKIFSFPFRSAIEVADAQDLCLSFSTFFKSGPLFKLSYRPNDSFNPFSLGIKTGIGILGSPMDAPMTVTADFNLLGYRGPRFHLHFRPQIGDFTFSRTVQSQLTNPPNNPSIFARNRVHDVDLSEGTSVYRGQTSREADDDLSLGNASFFGQRIKYSRVLNRIDNALSSIEVSARTMFKVRDRAAVKLRWSVKLPAYIKSSVAEEDDFAAKIPYFKMPCLALAKIEIEHMAAPANEGAETNDKAADEFSAVKKQLEDLRAETQSLKKCIGQLRSENSYQKDAPMSPSVGYQIR